MQHNYKADRERLEKSLDKNFSDPMFTLGRQQGAIDFCNYLRGKVDANALMFAWENFISKEGFLS
jgi:hypothetical protein